LLAAVAAVVILAAAVALVDIVVLFQANHQVVALQPNLH
jgi:hypothetical protein